MLLVHAMCTVHCTISFVPAPPLVGVEFNAWPMKRKAHDSYPPVKQLHVGKGLRREIANALTRHKDTAANIAQRFGVSRRTVVRIEQNLRAHESQLIHSGSSLAATPSLMMRIAGTWSSWPPKTTLKQRAYKALSCDTTKNESGCNPF